jgi:hypothetical protein
LQKQVATLLDTSFEQLKTADPFSVLKHLFSAGTRALICFSVVLFGFELLLTGVIQMETVRQYIVSLKLDPQKVAEVLAEHCFNSIREAYTGSFVFIMPITIF